MARTAALLFACSLASPALAQAVADAGVEDVMSLLQTNVHMRKPSGSSFNAAEVFAGLGDLLPTLSSLDMHSVIAKVGSVDENAVLATMAAAPLDPTTQVSGCVGLMVAIALKGDELAKPSVIEPMMQAVKNNVDNRMVVKSCFMALQLFNPTFNRERTLAINNGTHIGEAVAAVLRHYPHDRQMQKDALLYVAEFSTYVACEVQPPYVDAGCIDLVWDALDYFTGREYSDVQMSAWQGFSDHSGCRYSANAIANRGGKNVGAQRTVQFLREAIGNQFHPDTMHGGAPINLQYEIISVANGLLMNADDTHETFVQSGYGPLIMTSMRDQPDERSTNERACTALEFLSRNTTVRASLEAEGALELIAGAMERFKGQDHRMFVNAEVGNFYPVLPSCDSALRNFADNCVAAQDTLLRLGVLETYETMREDMRSTGEMQHMPELLRARRQQVGA